MVTIFGLLSWISILVTHICFVRARRAQTIEDTALAYVAPLGMWGSIGALIFCCIIALTKNFTAFFNQPDGTFDRKKFVEDFITGYVQLPSRILHGVDSGKVHWHPIIFDVHSGKAEIDREEEEYLANQAAINHANDSRFKKIYQKAFGVLF